MYVMIDFGLNNVCSYILLLLLSPMHLCMFTMLYQIVSGCGYTEIFRLAVQRQEFTLWSLLALPGQNKQKGGGGGGGGGFKLTTTYTEYVQNS